MVPLQPSIPDRTTGTSHPATLPPGWQSNVRLTICGSAQADWPGAIVRPQDVQPNLVHGADPDAPLPVQAKPMSKQTLIRLPCPAHKS